MIDKRYPPERGIWTLTSPSGKMWHGDTPMGVLRLELQDRIPAAVMLERLYAAVQEDEPAPETAAQVWSRFWSKIKGKEQ